VNGQTVAAIIVAGVMVLGMLGGVLSLTYRMGTLSGQIVSFMTTAQRDRSEVLLQLGKLEQQLDKHIDSHGK
jgi:hypothetical protein